jgi:hypothetical protein
MRTFLGKLLGIVCLLASSSSLRPFSPERFNRACLKLPLQTYDAQLDPSLAAVSGAILIGFGIVQSRISKSNRLLERIQEETVRLKKFRSLELEGDPEASGSKRALEVEIANLEQEYLSTVTFLKMSGLTLRFRVVSSDLAAALQKKEDLEITSAMKNNQENKYLAEDNKNSGLGRVFVGVILVSILVSLLNVLLTDPMSSAPSSSSLLFQYRNP